MLLVGTSRSAESVPRWYSTIGLCGRSSYPQFLGVVHQFVDSSFGRSLGIKLVGGVDPRGSSALSLRKDSQPAFLERLDAVPGYKRSNQRRSRRCYRLSRCAVDSSVELVLTSCAGTGGRTWGDSISTSIHHLAAGWNWAAEDSMSGLSESGR
jgi:hypothetical protein